MNLPIPAVTQIQIQFSHLELAVGCVLCMAQGATKFGILNLVSCFRKHAQALSVSSSSLAFPYLYYMLIEAMSSGWLVVGWLVGWYLPNAATQVHFDISTDKNICVLINHRDKGSA